MVRSVMFMGKVKAMFMGQVSHVHGFRSKICLSVRLRSCLNVFG